MRCPECGSETKVFNSRPRSRTNSIYRRRECLECSQRFSTTESVCGLPDHSPLSELRDKLYSLRKLSLEVNGLIKDYSLTPGDE